ncbi:MAG: hypothetical protein GKR93_10910 [Gammaproteobacteria bacterium]|nr:hypothetical protein [Gammaproteobacteria bacterium]
MNAIRQSDTLLTPRFLHKILLYLLLLPILSDLVLAEGKSVGTVVRISGQSEVVSKQGDLRSLKVRDRITSGDVILTGSNSWLSVNFYDLTRIVLRPNTEFKINKFPETRDAGEIELEIIRGGARVTTGTIAGQSLENFTLKTPEGLIQAGRAEWVVRICQADSCDVVSSEIKACSHFRKPETLDRQFVSVYKGELSPAYCSGQTRARVGESTVSGNENQLCELIEEVPCFVLYDQRLGRDKVRDFAKNLTLLPGMKAPKGRADGKHTRPPPRGDRPPPRGNRPPPRGNRPPPGRRPPPR